MLQFYLSSVAIYAIIISCVSKIFKNKFKENTEYLYGEDSNRAKLTDRLVNLFVLSAVPILRLLITGLIIWIATAKKETLDELKANVAAKKSL